jgi:hypothetical protein
MKSDRGRNSASNNGDILFYTHTINRSREWSESRHHGIRRRGVRNFYDAHTRPGHGQLDTSRHILFNHHLIKRTLTGHQRPTLNAQRPMSQWKRCDLKC